MSQDFTPAHRETLERMAVWRTTHQPKARKEIRAVLDHVDSLTADLAACREAQTWQPISTAPKDGSVLLGFDPADIVERDPFGFTLSGVEFIRWLDGDWLDPSTHVIRPTHWMPLPAPPSGETP